MSSPAPSLTATATATPLALPGATLSIEEATPPDGGVRVSITPVQRVVLRIVTPSGKSYPIVGLSEEAEQRISESAQKVAYDHQECELDLEQLISFRADGSVEKTFVDGDEGITDLRNAVRDAFGKKFVAFQTFHPGRRTHVDAAPSFSRKSARLQNLEFTDSDMKAALEGLPLEDKLKRLKRRAAIQQVLPALRQAIDDHLMLGVERPEATPDQLRRHKRLVGLTAAQKALGSSLEAVLSFEAAHPTSDLKAKQKHAQAWIQRHAVPNLTWTESLAQKKWNNVADEKEEAHFAEDLTRLGCVTRGEYQAFKADPRADGREVFFALLLDAIEKNDQDRIEELFKDTLFSKAFPEILEEDRERCQNRMIAAAKEVAAGLHRVDTSRLADDNELMSNYLKASRRRI